MKCPHCQTEVLDNARFCHVCGRSLQSELICIHCRHTNVLGIKFCSQCGQPLISTETAPTQSIPPRVPAKKISPEPTSCAGGRYQVKKFRGEGGKKRVYLAHHTVLDRDIAFAQIKTEKLDEESRERIKREAQVIGRLGDHPNIVTVYDFGEDADQQYMVLPLLSGRKD